MKQLTTSQEIINYLKQHPVATVFEISRALNTSKQNIQYHLNTLSQEKKVTISGTPQSPTTRIGRKARGYSANPEGASQNYLVLADHLLSIFLEEGPDIDARLIILAQNFFPQKIITKNQTTRLNEAIQILNSHGYKARWEAHFEGPKVIFTQCPYSGLIDKYPELCSLDRMILYQLTNINFKINNRLKSKDIMSNCSFNIMSDEELY
jgi:predicted ArsR family transcriptional regulator